ncbi:MAG: A/G-specific adenine glycosylase [Proteobacteria bacterium]|nr:A/G-specific adenine glycosylase [Pseudomonadota bacterium]
MPAKLSATHDHKRPRTGGKRALSDELLSWYDVHGRDLPWRVKTGAADPYRVWLSEIMLQQTTVVAVAPYYRAFLARWPDIASLAKAERDDILAAWAGLGYYSRAHNLHAAAQKIVGDLRGCFPASVKELCALPGIGPYTAAAIASMAFGVRAAAMDANAERVIARLFAIDEPLPKAKRRLAALAEPLVPEHRPGDFAQALMDVGALVCVPKRPLCARCPLARHCRARRAGIAERLPRKAPRRARPMRRGAAFVALDARGAIYLVRRPEKGLLGGMLQPPLGEWIARFPKRAAALEQAPFAGDWIKTPDFVRHAFTHFHLEIEVYVARFARRPKGKGQWVKPENLGDVALPTVMRKVISQGQGLPLRVSF